MKGAYQDYMSSFAIIPKEEKKKEIVNKLHELNETVLLLAKMKDTTTEILLPENIDRLEESKNEDDYYRAVYAYLVSLEELLGKYLDESID